MKNRKRLNKISLVVILLLLVVSLSGCAKSPEATLVPTPLPPTAEITTTSTVVTQRIVLVDPSNASNETVRTLLTDFAVTNSLGFEAMTTLPENLEAVKVVVFYGMPVNLVEVAGAAPQTQFVVVSQTATPTANVSIISVDPVHLAFMAGYIAAMTSEDWRSGALLTDDAGLGLADAFENGGSYHCGRCIPQYAPILEYPQVYTLSDQSDATAWSAQATALLSQTYANSVYIAPGGDIPEVLDQFSNAILYGCNPASVNLSRYTAILGVDEAVALQQVLPELLAGSGGKTITARVNLVVINDPNIVSPAKKDLFDQTAQALLDNLINPLSVP